MCSGDKQKGNRYHPIINIVDKGFQKCKASLLFGIKKISNKLTVFKMTLEVPHQQSSFDVAQSFQ